MSLTVKAYLEKDGKPDGEIRRFAIPGDVTSSFAYLSKKIADIFPSLRDGNFSLFWKDPDGDMVLFSTDEEQMEALGFVTESLFKVYVKVKDNQQGAPKPQEPEDQLHPGVVCDGCDGSIVGNRFKCVTCPDYDLCSVCEEKGIHTEHNMVKITQPAGGPFWGCGPPPPLPPRMGPRHGHPRPGEPFAPPPHFRRWMRKFMKKWHHKNSAGCSHDNKDDSPDDDDTTCDEAYLKSVGDSVAAMLDPMGIDVHVDVEHGGKRHCRGAGQGHRLGRGKGRGARDHKSCILREDSLKRKCPNKKHAGNSDQEKEKSDASSMEADKIDKTNVTIDLTAADGQATLAQTDAELTEELREQTERIALKDDDEQEVALIKEKDIQPVETAPRMDIQNGNKDHVDSSWTFVAPPTTQPAPVAPPANQPSHVELPPTQMTPLVPAEPIVPIPAPPITQVQPPQIIPMQAPPMTRSVQFQMPPQVVYPPSSAHVAQALQQMLAMGFNNDGGWLLRLLEAKNGDIIQVLDAIKPQPGRSRETNGGYRA